MSKVLIPSNLYLSYPDFAGIQSSLEFKIVQKRKEIEFAISEQSSA